MNKEDFKDIITSNTRLKKFLKGEKLYLKKQFGQNFLFDNNVIQKIISSIPLKKEHIIEKVKT